MKHYGLTIAEGTEITNVTVAQGSSFPSNENAGEMFFRTDESKLYVYDGTVWTEVGAGAMTPTTYIFTAINDQTTFSGNDDNGNSLTYPVDQVYVYLNGILLDVGDYTATDGTTVVLGVATETNDTLTVLALNGWSTDTLDGGSF